MPPDAMMDTFREVMQVRKKESALLKEFASMIAAIQGLCEDRGAGIARLAQGALKIRI
ncbi:hypothetical protein HBH56_042890 [Parastagonospora nodorum]|nr:hypothetical protein HBH56_042890 [Parastagonospora nodorum]KAH3933075.1 hypothetical protein HBH54_070640 [Parastagonospora nodorum]KAH4139556.1 hypothetical protein HBH45_093030 [Parastagonospora nodorum]KAH4168717.1 hypothetical protein HBH44_043580 [Parastagonospora nodorum]KAH4560185.1 hypothetical protein HBH84_199730 [Parastagonospora nodorum]